MLVRDLSHAISYPKAALLSKCIILGKNKKTFPCGQDNTFVLFPKLGDHTHIFPVYLISKILYFVMFLCRLTQKTKRNSSIYISNGSYKDLVDRTKDFCVNHILDRENKLEYK